TQNNLGLAYRNLGEVEDKAKNCQKAIEAFQEALKVRTLEELPQDYAMTQNNLGAAYGTLSDVESRSENCQKAIKAYQQALIVFKEMNLFLDYANTLGNLGTDYLKLSGVEDKEKNCQQALNAFKEAQKIFTKEEYRQQFQFIQDKIAQARAHCFGEKREESQLSKEELEEFLPKIQQQIQEEQEIQKIGALIYNLFQQNEEFTKSLLQEFSMTDLQQKLECEENSQEIIRFLYLIGGIFPENLPELLSSTILTQIQKKVNELQEPDLLNRFAWLLCQLESSKEELPQSLPEELCKTAEIVSRRSLDLADDPPIGHLDTLACCLFCQGKKLAEGKGKLNKLREAKELFNKIREKLVEEGKEEAFSWRVMVQVYELLGEQEEAEALRQHFLQVIKKKEQLFIQELQAKISAEEDFREIVKLIYSLNERDKNLTQKLLQNLSTEELIPKLHKEENPEIIIAFIGLFFSLVPSKTIEFFSIPVVKKIESSLLGITNPRILEDFAIMLFFSSDKIGKEEDLTYFYRIGEKLARKTLELVEEPSAKHYNILACHLFGLGKHLPEGSERQEILQEAKKFFTLAKKHMTHENQIPWGVLAELHELLGEQQEAEKIKKRIQKREKKKEEERKAKQQQLIAELKQTIIEEKEINKVGQMIYSVVQKDTTIAHKLLEDIPAKSLTSKLLKQEQPEEIVQFLTLLIYLNPSLTKKVLSEALLEKINSITEETTNHQVLNSFAWLFFLFGSAPEITKEEATNFSVQGEKLVKKAIRIADEEPVAYLDTLACCLLCQGKLLDGKARRAKLEEAEQFFLKAKEQRKDDESVTWEALVELFELLGKKEKAEEIRAQFINKEI
ncbi:MAG: tetratricopeptide repeat protein, partial [Candidatus Heimdallarchaeota archaeon]|nr:tetratricopeptide repeat protein [Candidatus Heimdallarchaeota archaeon]